MIWKRAARRPASERQDDTPPCILPGMLLYAVGDVHGRSDLLDRLVELIRRDAAASSEEFGGRATLVLLGDYVDRGPDSAGVLDRLLKLQADPDFEVVPLKGNHEEVLLEFLEDPGTGPAWLLHGGQETLASYGIQIPRPQDGREGWDAARRALAAAIPPDHLALLTALRLWAVCGDYVFVHAGVRPGVELERQAEHDLLWIRREFLTTPRAPKPVIVHGHTPTDRPEVRPGRVGIDTGAYASGVLTAVRLEGGSLRFIQTGSNSSGPRS